jgi:hypothetical protein
MMIGPAPTLPTAADAIMAVQDMVRTIGVRAAFKVTGQVLLYSGPPSKIFSAYMAKYGKRPELNHKRALKMVATSKKYAVIDNTEAGKRLIEYESGKTLYQYFESFYGDTKDGAGQLLFVKHATAVWAYASEFFMQAAKGNVETCIAGAGTNSVSYLYEIPALMKNVKVTSINDIPISVFQKIYFSGASDAHYQTFQKICQAEVAQARKRMLTARSLKRKVALRESYQSCRALFVLEREDTIAAAKPVSTPLPHTAASPIPSAFVIAGSHPRLTGAHLH